MLRVLLRLLTTLLLVTVLIARIGFPSILASEISSIRLVELANVERQKRDLTPLKYNEKLERAAYLKAENMFKEQYWAHYGPNNESPWQFILKTGYSYTYAGENLAKGFSTSEGVHDAWMASPTHRDNLLDGQFKEVGIAVVKGELLGTEVYLVVQMFGSTMEEASESATERPFLKITNPENGDILEDGIKDVRGIAKNIDTEAGITVFVSNKYVGKAGTEEDTFSLVLGESESLGNQTVTVKAKGYEDEYISDTITVTIRGDENAASVTDDCFVAKTASNEITLSYVCTKGASLSVTIGDKTYSTGADGLVHIPESSNLSVQSILSLTITFSNSDTVPYTTTLANLGVEDSKESSVPSVVGIGTVRTGIQIGFLAATFIFLLYAVDLLRKHQLSEHRHELLSFVLLISILFATFNFGIIRI